MFLFKEILTFQINSIYLSGCVRFLAKKIFTFNEHVDVLFAHEDIIQTMLISGNACRRELLSRHPMNSTFTLALAVRRVLQKPQECPSIPAHATKSHAGVYRP